MTVQTSYPLNSEQAFAGMKADVGFDRVESFLAEGSIEFGVGVIGGTTAGEQVKTADAVARLLGISLHIHKEPSAPGLNDAKYNDKDSVSVLTQGQVWMPVETSNQGTIAIGDPAFINVAIVGAELGKVTSVATANVAVGGFIEEYDSATKLALVSINLP